MTQTTPEERLAEKVWTIGNRLTGFDTKKSEILAACKEALDGVRDEGIERGARGDV